MKNLFFLLQKEFKQIFRNPAILRLIMLMPIIQLILIPLAADYEVRNIRFSVIDHDHSEFSTRLIQKLEASEYLQLYSAHEHYSEALTIVENGETDLIMTIPSNFERDLFRENISEIHIAADAVNGVKAGMGTMYASRIISDFNRIIRQERMGTVEPMSGLVSLQSAQWYNPHSNYHWFMVPGILAILVTMVGSFLAALNIVAEKESGTIEQLNVTPIKKYQFILGKLIPFWILGLITILIGIFVAYFFYGLWPKSSVIVVLAYSAIYLVGVLGIGLLVSTFAENQQQATLFAFFFMMVFILMGGLYTPVESMPDWSQWIAKANPPMYFIRGIRAMYLKGSSLFDLRLDILKLLVFAVFFNGLAIWSYRKRV